MSFLWGIDLGGTKVEGVVLDLSKRDANELPHVVTRQRIPSHAEQGYEAVLESIRTLIDLLSEDSGLQPKQIGVGTPGIEDPKTATMKNCNSTALNGRNLRKDLSGALEIGIRLANDANCFALAEHLFGAARGASTSFGVIMGTGVGGGLIMNNQLHSGHQGIGGEWGHNNAIENGAACYCGCNGCVETIISGPALERFYTTVSGEQRKLPYIVEAAVRNDAYARETIDRLCYYFGKSLASVINVLDPEVIVLGGGVSNIPDLYTQGVDQLNKFVFNKQNETKVVKNQLGDSAGVFGAALLYSESYF